MPMASERTTVRLKEPRVDSGGRHVPNTVHFIAYKTVSPNRDRTYYIIPFSTGQLVVKDDEVERKA